MILRSISTNIISLYLLNFGAFDIIIFFITIFHKFIIANARYVRVQCAHIILAITYGITVLL